MAPRRLEDSATATDGDRFSSVENAKPEKKSGRVRMAVRTTWLRPGLSAATRSRLTRSPNASETRSRP